MPYFCLLLIFLFSFEVQAAVYKTVDENGKVVYTDVKPRNSDSDEVELRGLTPIKGVTDSLYSPHKKELEQKQVPPSVELKIIEPESGATIRNTESFSVRLSVYPKLLKSWKIRLYLDDVLIETKRSLVFQLANVDRGTHQIKVEVIDVNGQILVSAGNTIHVHRTVIVP